MSADETEAFPDDWTGDRTVSQIAREELGIEVSVLRARFEQSGWRHLGESEERCPTCGFILHLARKPYRTQRLGETRLARYSAFICPAAPLRLIPQSSRRAREVAPRDLAMSPQMPLPRRGRICGGTGELPPGFYRSDPQRTGCRGCEGRGIVWSL